MTTHISVNNSKPLLIESTISPEKVSSVDITVPETEIIESTFFKHKAYVIEDGKITKSQVKKSASDVPCSFVVKNLSFSDFSSTIWNDQFDAQYEDHKFQEKLIDNARNHFDNSFMAFYDDVSDLFSPQENSIKTYFVATSDEFVLWSNNISVVYDLKNLNDQISNILFQHLIEEGQQQYGPIKGWFLDVTRTKHSRAKWAFSLSQKVPLFNNGLNRILGVFQRIKLCVRTHRDTLTTYFQRSIVKCFVKLKTGIRSVEDVKNGIKEKSDSKGQRLGISQTYSRYFAWT